ncbi:MAG: hypothetical protein OXE94_03605 [Aestuariivita sp.]|nr:hypothetical protein [Aestuariivita sp.]MCY4201582.1 hypothetical protein [Aestuariivita sp.]
MKRLLTNRTVGITELREPAKVFEKAAGKPVAVLKNNECIGYLVPADAVDENRHQPVDRAQLDAVLQTSAKKVQPVLDFLRDK